MNNNFLSYGKQNITEQDIDAVIEVLKSNYLTQGPKIDEFEKSICNITGAKYCIAVNNGTSALDLAVRCLELNSNGNLEGITSPITFVASSNSMIYNNIKPVFSDIDEKTYNIDFDEIKKKINSKTKLIIPVHFAGQACDMVNINELAKSNNFYVIEDASHAIGSKYSDGSNVGNCKYSDLTTFSFHPVKTITTCEGGAITTNNKVFYDRLKILRTHGITKENMTQNPGPWYYEMQSLGYNYRITDIQCALGISQLKRLQQFIKRRREIVSFYNESFRNLNNVIIPFEKNIGNSAFHLYVLQINFNKINKSRKTVMELLKEKNIGTQVHYIPVYTQPFYIKTFNYKKGLCSKAEAYYEKALSIPLYPDLTDRDLEYITKFIKEIVD